MPMGIFLFQGPRLTDQKNRRSRASLLLRAKNLEDGKTDVMPVFMSGRRQMAGLNWLNVRILTIYRLTQEGELLGGPIGGVSSHLRSGASSLKTGRSIQKGEGYEKLNFANPESDGSFWWHLVRATPFARHERDFDRFGRWHEHRYRRPENNAKRFIRKLNSTSFEERVEKRNRELDG